MLSLWMTTRMPLTRANLVYVTGAPRAKIEKWLDELVADGVLDVDADDDGEMVWGVRGAARAQKGPDKPEEVKKLADLKAEVAAGSSGASASNALALMRVGAGAARSLATTRGDGKKSIVASSVLSFFFGPIGWLYAGSWKEAVPGALVWLILIKLLPHWAILAPLWLTAMAVSGGIGLLYARKYNDKGERASLFDDTKALPPHRP